MYDMSITFGSTGITLDLNTKVDGIYATAQEALINTAVIKGDDKIYVDRGTELFSDAVKYGVVNYSDALHIANFAAADTVLFNQQYNSSSVDMITDYSLQPFDVSSGGLLLNALITSRKGITIGVEKSLKLI